MKKIVIATCIALIGVSAFACNPMDWRLVKQAPFGSGFDTACTYQSGNYTTTIIVKSSFCPMSPC